MTLQTRIQQLQLHLRALEQLHHRPLNTVQLLAVSKGRSAADIVAAHQAGLTDFGENYYQEALGKMKQLTPYPLNWHFIGPMQSNKIKGIARYFSWVHSVCETRTAVALHQHRPVDLPPLNVCVQVNIDHEVSKSGVHPKQALTLLQNINALPRLHLRGLMIIPMRNVTESLEGNAFQRAAKLLHAFNLQLNHAMDTLSMGMTDSLDEAIAAGSTLVRIGRGIFGDSAHA